VECEERQTCPKPDPSDCPCAKFHWPSDFSGASIKLGEGSVTKKVLKMYHPEEYDYFLSTFLPTKFDLMLIKIEPIDLEDCDDPKIQALSILDESNIEGCMATMTGRGNVGNGKNNDDTPLLEMHTTIHNTGWCNDEIRKRFSGLSPALQPVFQHSFCTLTQDDRDGSGQGDSGGPIVVNVGSTEDPEYALAGVVAYGRPRVYYPSGGHNYNAHLTGYTRASDFKRFILSPLTKAPLRNGKNKTNAVQQQPGRRQRLSVKSTTVLHCATRRLTHSVQNSCFCTIVAFFLHLARN